MTKGEETRSAVLGHALSLASELGLEGVSIGQLAERAGMSKSGLFAHFKSKEALQLAVLDEATTRFVALVVAPALRKPRGEPRVRALFDHWLAWSHAEFMPGGCIFVQAMVELDDRPGIVRDRLVASQRDWLDTIATAIRIAKTERHFDAKLDEAQLAHEIATLAYGHHLVARTLRDAAAETRTERAFDRMIRSARPTG
ncbi:MAG: TetR family transcriptional regulator [Myxococcota bacterium]|nr:TetR family transcriptional regulator [Myxococcota bacterium]